MVDSRIKNFIFTVSVFFLLSISANGVLQQLHGLNPSGLVDLAGIITYAPGITLNGPFSYIRHINLAISGDLFVQNALLPWAINALLLALIIWLVFKWQQYRSGLSNIARLLIKYLPESRPAPKTFNELIRHIQESLRLLKQQQVEAEQRCLQAQGQWRQAAQTIQELEQQLAEQHFWQTYFWENTDLALALLDPDQQILKANPAFCQKAHLTQEELSGRNINTLFGDPSPIKHLSARHAPYKTEILQPVQPIKTRLWFGKIVWWQIRWHSFPVNGNRYQTLVVIEDQTELMTKIAELAQREKHFQLLFNKANDPVFVNRLTTDQRFGKFIEVNQKAIDTYLYSREEFEHLNPLTLIPPEYRKLQRVITQRLLEEGHVIYEIEYLRKDKRRIPVEINAHLFTYHDQPTVLSIVRDVSERKRAQQTLKNFSLQLRNLASRLQDIREEERSMIAREIHDELGQLLTVLKIEISLLCRQFSNDNPLVQSKVATISDLINQAVQSTQQITAKLRPGILDEVGLVAALEWQAHEFSKHTHIPCKIYVPDQEIELEKDKATALFRIFQEALTNIARHAQAERVSIFLKNTEQKVILEVVDNGVGINRQQIESPKSLGLLGMRERAMVFGGQLEIDGVPGQGTRVKVELPFKEQ